MKVTCPTCKGKCWVDDLAIIETDLYYSRGNLRGIRQADSPKGNPMMSCITCFGQGWIDTTGAGEGISFLQLVGGFWVIPDAVDRPDGAFMLDASGYVIISQSLNDALSLGAYSSSDFITLI